MNIMFVFVHIIALCTLICLIMRRSNLGENLVFNKLNHYNSVIISFTVCLKLHILTQIRVIKNPHIVIKRKAEIVDIAVLFCGL